MPNVPIATLCAIPIFMIIVPGVHYYLYPYIHDRFLVTGLGISIAFCVYYITKGIDKFIDKKRDNPEPFEVRDSMDDAFANILDVLENRHIGPYFWRIRIKDVEDMQIQGALDFQEQHHILGHPPVMMPRQMMVDITFEEIEQSEQKDANDDDDDDDDDIGELEKLRREAQRSSKYQTKVKLQWYVDSPGNRTKCNEIIKDHTYEFEKACGLHQFESNEEDPMDMFIPPAWALIFLAGMIYFNFQKFEQIETAKAKAAEQQQKAEADRQRKIEAAKERQRKFQQEQEERRRRYNQRNRSNNSNYKQPSYGNTFAPRLEINNPPPRYKPKVPDYKQNQDKGNIYNFQPYKINKPKDKTWKKPKTLDPTWKPPAQNDSNKVKWRSTYGSK